MRSHIKNIIKFILFISLGVVLFLLVYRDFDFKQSVYELQKINYYWFILFFICMTLSNISRTIRWQMLIKSYGGKAGFTNTFLAVLLGYFANMALPRLGEVSRCAVVSKYEKQPLSMVLGTMISERLIDILLLILLAVFTLLTQKDVIISFLVQNPEFSDRAYALFSLKLIIPIFLIILAGFFIALYISKGMFNKYAVFKKLSEFINSFWHGLISIRKVKNMYLFVFHSFFIWIMYFLMIYVAFPAFDELHSLDLSAAIMLFLAASFGMLAPAPNGAGAYHFMISRTLLIYGICLNTALIFALVVHAVQTIIIIIGGVLALIILPVYNNKKATDKT